VSLIMCTGGEYRGVRHDRHFSACVYRQLKRGRSGDEVRPGWRVN
jgi:hypothetical protein